MRNAESHLVGAVVGALLAATLLVGVFVASPAHSATVESPGKTAALFVEPGAGR
jgi:hypothetical protein